MELQVLQEQVEHQELQDKDLLGKEFGMEQHFIKSTML
jgi:hypothetical protein